jgi:hypothetical protein
MRKVAMFVPFLCTALLAVSLRPAQQPAALKTAALESHEGLTISAQPWTRAVLYKEKFGKNSPYAVGVLAIQVIFRNDSDEAVRVNLDRIRLLLMLSEDNRQSLEPLSADEVADAVRNPGARDPTATRRRIPAKTKGWRDKHWDEVQQAAQNAAIPSNVIAPHSTMQGLLYFDLRAQWDLLNSAHLYVPDLLTIEKHHTLLYFEIDLSHTANP